MPKCTKMAAINVQIISIYEYTQTCRLLDCGLKYLVVLVSAKKACVAFEVKA